MSAANPYEASVDLSRNGLTAGVLRESWGWVLTSCLMGAAVPIAFVAYTFYQEYVYDTSMPPGNRPCGLIVFVCFVVKVCIVIVGTPICGMIGGLVGLVASKVFRRIRSDF